MHQVHHSAESHMFNKNYGMATNIYDWLFGTLYMPRPDEVYRWGLNDDEYGLFNPHLTAKDFYLKPVREIFSMTKSGIRVVVERIARSH